MKSINTILLSAALLTGATYTYAMPAATVKVSDAANEIQDRHLSGFNAVDAEGSVDVYIVQGQTESVKVEAPADMMDHIITEVQGTTLRIHDKNSSGWHWGNWGTHKKIAVYVSVREIHEIGITGSGDVYFKEGIRANSLRIRVSGSGDVQGIVETKTLDCSISGSGDMKLAGHAEQSNVSVSGSGDYSARGLATQNTAVRVSGSGDANINVSNNLEAAVSGSGDVSYTGGAQHVVKSKSGSGDISGN
jgi:Putative auto-transporter adhesin, head GIN domain